MKNPERQGTGPTGEVCPEYFNIQDLSRYLSIKTSSIYAMVQERSIPHYRVGRLIRFKRYEIDEWMEGNKKDCVDPEQMARKVLRPGERTKLDVDRVVQKAIDGTRGQGYTTPHGKPDRYQGPRKGGS